MGEEEKGRRGGELLTLEQHRRAGNEQGERGERAVSTGAREQVDALTAPGIGDLIVVLQEHHERRGVEIEPRRAAPFFLPRGPLPLVQVSPLSGGKELLRRATVIGV